MREAALIVVKEQRVVLGRPLNIARHRMVHLRVMKSPPTEAATSGSRTEENSTENVTAENGASTKGELAYHPVSLRKIKRFARAETSGAGHLGNANSHSRLSQPSGDARKNRDKVAHPVDRGTGQDTDDHYRTTLEPDRNGTGDFHICRSTLHSRVRPGRVETLDRQGRGLPERQAAGTGRRKCNACYL